MRASVGRGFVVVATVATAVAVQLFVFKEPLVSVQTAPARPAAASLPQLSLAHHSAELPTPLGTAHTGDAEQAPPPVAAMPVAQGEARADTALVEARVEAALAHLQSTGGRIEQKQLDDERRRLEEKTRELSAVDVREPSVREIVDHHGMRWLELSHSNGEVRYELPIN